MDCLVHSALENTDLRCFGSKPWVFDQSCGYREILAHSLYLSVTLGKDLMKYLIISIKITSKYLWTTAFLKKSVCILADFHKQDGGPTWVPFFLGRMMSEETLEAESLWNILVCLKRCLIKAGTTGPLRARFLPGQLAWHRNKIL